MGSLEGVASALLLLAQKASSGLAASLSSCSKALESCLTKNKSCGVMCRKERMCSVLSIWSGM